MEDIGFASLCAFKILVTKWWRHTWGKRRCMYSASSFCHYDRDQTNLWETL